LPVSCPAKAGHPAFIDPAVVTGSSAFADDDDRILLPSANHNSGRAVSINRAAFIAIVESFIPRAFSPRQVGQSAMLKGLSNLFSSGPAPFGGPKDKIPLAEVLKRNWLELWYQPKIELKTMRLVGAEALVRCRHPERGVVAPFFFLPDADEASLHALTEQVILTALGDWEIFNEYGVAMKFAVNVPVSAFVKLPITRMLAEARPRSKDWPGMILEVTEDQIINDLNLANEVAGALRALNCNLALDDFGAGYSSLARLRQLPFSELKIDRSYVMDCDHDQLNAGLCETIVELGKRFGLKTVAEGIETTHESHKLQGIGCHVGQGYLFAKPMPKGELIGLMRKRLMKSAPVPQPVRGLGFA
jgi:EAL domain-containing protein (putative c-di-GMP-specific phosphodiesterase class I)